MSRNRELTGIWDSVDAINKQFGDLKPDLHRGFDEVVRIQEESVQRQQSMLGVQTAQTVLLGGGLLVGSLALLDRFGVFDHFKHSKQAASPKSPLEQDALDNLSIANDCLQKGAFDRALKHANRCIDNDPRISAAWIVKAQAMLQLNDWNGLDNLFREGDSFVANFPAADASNYELCRGRFLIASGRSMEAFFALHKSLKLDRGNYESVFQLARAKASDLSDSKTRRFSKQEISERRAHIVLCFDYLLHIDGLYAQRFETEPTLQARLVRDPVECELRKSVSKRLVSYVVATNKFLALQPKSSNRSDKARGDLVAGLEGLRASIESQISELGRKIGSPPSLAQLAVTTNEARDSLVDGIRKIRHFLAQKPPAVADDDLRAKCTSLLDWLCRLPAVILLPNTPDEVTLSPLLPRRLGI